MSIVSVGRDAKAGFYDVNVQGIDINNVNVNLFTNASLNGELLFDNVTFKNNRVTEANSLLSLANRPSTQLF